MDLATAQTHLDQWIAADTATAAGKSYSINNRSLDRSDAKEIREQMAFWQARVNELTAVANGAKSGSVAIASWNS